MRIYLLAFVLCIVFTACELPTAIYTPHAGARLTVNNTVLREQAPIVWWKIITYIHDLFQPPNSNFLAM